ncbi:MAG: DNA topoisomerase [Clostridiales bacterium]|nr:DNA topoisomerase [Clostridiales bacterium]
MVTKNIKTYTNESITQLKGADRVRLRPAVIFGSDGIEGCEHSIFEIISNSIDEAREGHGKKIEVTLHSDYSVTVKDYGRGIPVDYNPVEQRWNWELVFCELYAGGKYDNNSGDVYNFSLGLNGLGLCATQYSSEYMDADITFGGFRYHLHFEKGENIGGLKKQPTNSKQTGTAITWLPDREVFTDIATSPEYFKQTLKRQAVVNAGLSFVFYDEANDETTEFLYERGIRDYMDELTVRTRITEPVFWESSAVGRDREDKKDYKLKFEVAFCFDNESSVTQYYHNSSFLEYGGSPDKAVRTAFTYAIDNYLKTNNAYKKDEKKITFADIEDSLVLLSNSFSTETSYENQTKKSITNKFIQDYMTEYLKKSLYVYFIENKADAEKITAQALINKRSRESAEQTRLNVKKKLTGSLDISNRVEKFVNCRSKDTKLREIYIVEGDSAMGACKLARNPDFQAIMPIRGKILNCLKADYNRIFASDIITDLVRVLGCGVEIQTGKHSKDISSFDISKLNWSKIIICTDADVDGYQIRTLVLTMLYRLMPELIIQKKVFIAESPLYEISSAKKTYFAYSDREKTEITSKLSGKYKIQRSKGLGENEPDMMSQTTMNPATRKLIQVVPEDVKKTKEMFEMLLGNNLAARKLHIEEEGHRFIDWTDVM